MISIYFISFLFFYNLILLINAYQSSSSSSSSSTTSSLQLINSDGICKGENQINAFIESNPYIASSSSLDTSEIKLCNILDCTGDNNINTINQVFNTNLVHSNGKQSS